MAPRGGPDVDAQGCCVRHPFFQLRRVSKRTGRWVALLDSCPLCDADDDGGSASVVDGGRGGSFRGDGVIGAGDESVGGGGSIRRDSRSRGSGSRGSGRGGRNARVAAKGGGVAGYDSPSDGVVCRTARRRPHPGPVLSCPPRTRSSGSGGSSTSGGSGSSGRARGSAKCTSFAGYDSPSDGVVRGPAGRRPSPGPVSSCPPRTRSSGSGGSSTSGGSGCSGRAGGLAKCTSFAGYDSPSDGIPAGRRPSPRSASSFPPPPRKLSHFAGHESPGGRRPSPSSPSSFPPPPPFQTDRASSSPTSSQSSNASPTSLQLSDASLTPRHDRAYAGSTDGRRVASSGRSAPRQQYSYSSRPPPGRRSSSCGSGGRPDDGSARRRGHGARDDALALSNAASRMELSPPPPRRAPSFDGSDAGGSPGDQHDRSTQDGFPILRYQPFAGSPPPWQSAVATAPPSPSPRRCQSAPGGRDPPSLQEEEERRRRRKHKHKHKRKERHRELSRPDDGHAGQPRAPSLGYGTPTLSCSSEALNGSDDDGLTGTRTQSLKPPREQPCPVPGDINADVNAYIFAGNNNYDWKGRCVRHPHNQLRKRNSFSCRKGEWTVLMIACPDCCVEELMRIKRSDAVGASLTEGDPERLERDGSRTQEVALRRGRAEGDGANRQNAPEDHVRGSVRAHCVPQRRANSNDTHTTRSTAGTVDSVRHYVRLSREALRRGSVDGAAAKDGGRSAPEGDVRGSGERGVAAPLLPPCRDGGFDWTNKRTDSNGSTTTRSTVQNVRHYVRLSREALHTGTAAGVAARDDRENATEGDARRSIAAPLLPPHHGGVFDWTDKRMDSNDTDTTRSTAGTRSTSGRLSRKNSGRGAIGRADSHGTADRGQCRSEALGTRSPKYPDAPNPEKKKKKKKKEGRIFVRLMRYTDHLGAAGLYTGTVDRNLLPHGRGAMLYDDGTRADRRWRHGRPRRPREGDGGAATDPPESGALRRTPASSRCAVGADSSDEPGGRDGREGGAAAPPSSRGRRSKSKSKSKRGAGRSRKKSSASSSGAGDASRRESVDGIS